MSDENKICYYYEAIKNIFDELALTNEEKEIIKVIIKNAYDRQVNNK